MDFESNDIYIFSLFSLFVSVYVYASVCDFVCIALLLPFDLGFCLSTVFFFFYYFKKIFNNYFLFQNFFILFYFILFYLLLSFFLFFLPFILSHVDERLLVLQPGVRAVPLRGESQVQDTGPQETSQLHVISNGKSSPRGTLLNAKTQLHSETSKIQCWTSHAKQLARQECRPTH